MPTSMGSPENSGRFPVVWHSWHWATWWHDSRHGFSPVTFTILGCSVRHCSPDSCSTWWQLKHCWVVLVPTWQPYATQMPENGISLCSSRYVSRCAVHLWQSTQLRDSLATRRCAGCGMRSIRLASALQSFWWHARHASRRGGANLKNVGVSPVLKKLE